MENEQAVSHEALFQQSIKEALAKVHALPAIDLVIGIPFYNEKAFLPDLIRTVDSSLADANTVG